MQFNYQGDEKWTWSDKPPWDSRPTVDNIWAAFTAAEWATQQRLNWSQRERVSRKDTNGMKC